LLAGHPRQYLVLHNIALCHERMFRYDQAFDFYTRYLVQGGPQAEDRDEIEHVLQTLHGLLGEVTIGTNVPSELWVDGRRLGDAPATRLLPAGKHVIELRAPLHETQRRELDVRARGKHALHVELERLSQYSGPSPVFFWTGAGLTVVAAGVGVVFGVQALSDDEAGQERRKQDPFSNTIEDEEDVQRLALTADIAFGAAALLAVGSTVLFFLTDWDATARDERKPPAKAASARPSALRVQPWLGRREAGLGLRGALP
jgi:hypothetical protein